jgi:hypothetical protein
LDVINATTVIRSGLLLLQLSGIETLSGLIETSSALVETEYSSSTWSDLVLAQASGVLVRDEIITSGALGLYEGAFITSGVINQSIQDLEVALQGLRFANFAQFETTINTVTTDIVANSGVYTTDSYNTFDIAYQSGLIYQTAITASGVFARVNDVQVVNTDLITINDQIIAASGALAYKAIQSNLVLSLDASNVVSYSGVDTLWNDLSTSNNDATLVGGVGFSSDFGGILVFDGMDDYGYTSNLVASPGPTVFTIEAWIRPHDLTVGKIVGFENTSGLNSTEFDRHLFFNDAGKLSFGIFATANTTISYDVDLSINTWTHVLATYSTGTQEMELYVSGVLVTSGTATAPQVYSGVWRFGGGILDTWITPTGVQYFDGDIAEIRIYDMVLSPAQVLENFNGTKDRFAPDE